LVRADGLINLAANFANYANFRKLKEQFLVGESGLEPLCQRIEAQKYNGNFTTQKTSRLSATTKMLLNNLRNLRNSKKFALKIS